MTSDIGRFLEEAVSFERKKLILPTLAVIVILSAVFLTGHLRAQGVDEKTTNASVTAMTELTVIFIEHGGFNESIEGTAIQRSDAVTQRASEMQPMDDPLLSMSNAPILANGLLLGAIYYTPFFPVAPGGESIDLMSTVGSTPDKAIFFSNKDGYYLTEEMPESLVLIFYRQRKFEDLADRVNRTNMTLEEFRQEAREIKSHSPQSEEVRRHVENNRLTGPEESTGTKERLTRLPSESGYEAKLDRMARHTVNGEIKEIGLVHFLPAIVAAFVWNYLLNGFILVSYRRFRDKFRGKESVNKQQKREATTGNDPSKRVQ